MKNQGTHIYNSPTNPDSHYDQTEIPMELLDEIRNIRARIANALQMAEQAAKSLAA